jgi:hypothetical protein
MVFVDDRDPAGISQSHQNAVDSIPEEGKLLSSAEGERTRISCISP